MSKRFLVVLVGMLAIGLTANAAVFDPCTGSAVSDINTTVGVGSGNTVACDGSPFTFSNFAVSVVGGGSAQLSIAGSGFSTYSGGVAYLTFQIGFVTGPVSDILLFYQVNGPLGAVDLNNGGTGVTIQEQVFDTCNTPLYGGGCTNLLAQIVVGPGSSATSAAFVSADNITFIKKDIQYASQTSFISDFTNSQHVVPEPMTLSLMGVGLLGLGLMRRRQVKK